MVAKPEIVPREPLEFHQNQRHRVADREHNRDAGARRQPMRAGLVHDTHIDHDIAEIAQFGLGMRGYGDHGAQTDVSSEANHLDHFASLAAGGKSDDGVFGSYEAEVAMRGLAGVQVCRGSAGRAKGRSEFTRYVPGLADAGGEDFTLGIAKSQDGALEVRRDAHRRYSGSLRGQDFRDALLNIEEWQKLLSLTGDSFDAGVQAALVTGGRALLDVSLAGGFIEQ
jgi:hypothetical protein